MHQETHYLTSTSDRMRNAGALAAELQEPRLPVLIRQFLYDQLYGSDLDDEVPIDECPAIQGSVAVHHSARATFYAPSDHSGSSGMNCQMIRSNPSFGGRRRYDTVLVKVDDREGFLGMCVARIKAFMVIKHDKIPYETCLVEWYRPVSNEPHSDTGLWIVEPEPDAHGNPNADVIHVDCIVRPCHLIGVCGDQRLPRDLCESSPALDIFESFYVNHYIDYHAHECTQ
jgi:hypothetical protein